MKYSEVVIHNVAGFIKQKDVILTAAAFVVGLSFQDVIKSFVNDIISPPINAYVGGIANGQLTITKPTIPLIGSSSTTSSPTSTTSPTTTSTTTSTSTSTITSSPTSTSTPTPTPASTAATDAITIRYGKFLQTIMIFVITLVATVEFIKYVQRLVNRVN